MAMGFSGSKGGIVGGKKMAIGFSGSKGGIVGGKKMALGLSGSKGGINNKSKLAQTKYVEIFRNLIEDGNRSNRIPNKAETIRAIAIH